MSDHDLITSGQQIYNDATFAALEYIIADFTAVKEFPISSKTIQVVSSLDKANALRNPHIRVALWGNDLVMKGLSNMYSANLGPDSWESRYFEDEVELRKWLAETREPPET